MIITIQYALSEFCWENCTTTRILYLSTWIELWSPYFTTSLQNAKQNSKEQAGVCTAKYAPWAEFWYLAIIQPLQQTATRGATPGNRMPSRVPRNKQKSAQRSMLPEQNSGTWQAEFCIHIHRSSRILVLGNATSVCRGNIGQPSGWTEFSTEICRQSRILVHKSTRQAEFCIHIYRSSRILDTKQSSDARVWEVSRILNSTGKDFCSCWVGVGKSSEFLREGSLLISMQPVLFGSSRRFASSSLRFATNQTNLLFHFSVTQQRRMQNHSIVGRSRIRGPMSNRMLCSIDYSSVSSLISIPDKTSSLNQKVGSRVPLIHFRFD